MDLQHNRTKLATQDQQRRSGEQRCPRGWCVGVGGWGACPYVGLLQPNVGSGRRILPRLPPMIPNRRPEWHRSAFDRSPRHSSPAVAPAARRQRPDHHSVATSARSGAAKSRLAEASGGYLDYPLVADAQPGGGQGAQERQETSRVERECMSMQGASSTSGVCVGASEGKSRACCQHSRRLLSVRPRSPCHGTRRPTKSCVSGLRINPTTKETRPRHWKWVPRLTSPQTCQPLNLNQPALCQDGCAGYAEIPTARPKPRTARCQRTLQAAIAARQLQPLPSTQPPRRSGSTA